MRDEPKRLSSKVCIPYPLIQTLTLKLNDANLEISKQHEIQGLANLQRGKISDEGKAKLTEILKKIAEGVKITQKVFEEDMQDMKKLNKYIKTRKR